MARAASVILLEFNELTPSLMFRLMRDGELPNFQRLYREAQVYVTDAQEQGMNLNPWVQWVTVHSGLPAAEHGVFLLGEGEKLAAPSLGDLVSAAGLRVWLCGSMNVRLRPPVNGAFLPDPWAVDARPQPAELEPFFRFVGHQVQEHTNPEAGLGIADYARFLGFMLGHGLSPSTAWAAARQLLRERSGRYGWMRVAILDRLQFDLFCWYYRRLRPHFATFFLNSVAHLQHTHWRDMEPEKFTLKPPPDERAEFEGAVRFGYRENDRLVGRFLDLAGADATLIFCTALSQQPDLRFERSDGKRFYRPRDFDQLAAFAGIAAPHRCAPVMSEEFWLEFASEPESVAGEAALRALEVEGEAAFNVSRRGTSVYAGCRLHGAVPADAKLTQAQSGASIRFFSLLYQAETLKSGMHHTDGLLWIRTPGRSHAEHAEKVPLTAIAPTVMSLLGLPLPAQMRAQPLL